MCVSKVVSLLLSSSTLSIQDAYFASQSDMALTVDNWGSMSSIDSMTSGARSSAIFSGLRSKQMHNLPLCFDTTRRLDIHLEGSERARLLGVAVRSQSFQSGTYRDAFIESVPEICAEPTTSLYMSLHGLHEDSTYFSYG